MNNPTPTRLAITHSVATISHINIRKEGADDKKELAADIKLLFPKLPGTVVECFDAGLAPLFWTEDNDGGLFVRSPLMEAIGFANEVHNADVSIADMRWPACKVKRFALSPVDGGYVNLTCSVSIMPSSTEVAKLAKLVQDGAFVTIEQPEDLFSEPGAAGSDSAPPKPRKTRAAAME
jgi:hypothetical protein